MFGIYGAAVRGLPEGRLRGVLLPTLGRPPAVGRPVLERPGYWVGARLTHTMADSRRGDWERVLAEFRGQVRRVLEIGSYEGQSALFWLNFFGCRVTCVDTWANRAPGVWLSRQVEAHFDRNVAGLGVRKIKDESTSALHRLRGEAFDLVYVDGDHSRDQVLVDSLLAWRLLRVGGVMIWDDYRDYRPDLADADRPVRAIDAFVALQGSAISVLADTGQQLFAVRQC